MNGAGNIWTKHASLGGVIAIQFIFVVACSTRDAAAVFSSHEKSGTESSAQETPVSGQNSPDTSDAASNKLLAVVSKSTAEKSRAPEKNLYPVLGTPQTLSVPGFNDAAFVTPATPGSEAQPVVIVLHGNFDRPEWQCEMWRDVASWYGWVLCPRGVRTPWATLEEDRWTYKGGAKRVSKEMMAALSALEARFPDAVTRKRAVLVGFSLGAILLPELIGIHPNEFSTVFLIEGGLKQLDNYIYSMKRNGVKRIGLAMSTAANRQKVPGIEKKIKRSGLRSVYVDMRGAGHNYRMDFGTTGKTALRQLLNESSVKVSNSDADTENGY